MKPRVWSGFVIPIERDDETGKTVRREDKKRRVWCVAYDAGCCGVEGHVETKEFAKFSTALRFAYYVAMGGSEWAFIA